MRNINDGDPIMRSITTRGLMAATVMLLMLPAPVLHAQQSSASEPVTPPQSISKDDGETLKLEQRPGLSITLRGGLFRPDAGAPMFDVMTSLLTLDKSDFVTQSVGIEFGAWVGTRTEILVGFDVGHTAKSSEFRSRQGTSDPVRQSTQFTGGPDIFAGVKLYLFSKGSWNDEGGWVQRRWNTFVAGGGGQLHYKLQQSGDFVDYQDETVVFPAVYRSRGGSPFGFVSVGGDVKLFKRTGVVAEARYQRGNAPLTKNAFHDNLDQLDMSGFRITLGLTRHF